ncbi:MAG TPA: HlyD family efflux transporter periplasmic adaptor subunit [Gemmatimonadales bacterium]|nr:HlyD family efflux transporter periplasmic adaptor subunit [Gemmatimonadales bacterium]
MPAEPAQSFLDTTPPNWVARGLAYVIIAAFVLGILGAVVVKVPETVSGPFTLIPIRGTDPVRAVKSGVLVEVEVAEGDNVTRGETLFLLRSSSMSDRAADRLTVESQLRTNEQRMTILKSQYDTRKRSDEADGRRLENRVQFLQGLIASKSKRLALTKELADSSSSGAKRGAIGKLEASRLELEYSTLQEEVDGAQNDLAEAKADIARLEQDGKARDLEYEETRRGLTESLETGRIRATSLQRDLVNATEVGFSVTAPCDGTVLRLHVNAPGAVVQEGDILSEMGCAGDRLQGELRVPEGGVAQVRPGQGVKLRYDAFPYQRYGVRFATVRWLGPAGSTARDSGEFRALVDLADDSIRVHGQLRALLPGMGGRADIVVGKRSLVSYAFEPIRALRENFAEPPSR